MVNQTLNNHKIAILALQETHLDEQTADQIRSCFDKKMNILYSANPNNPRATAGVAFVINKACIAPMSICTMELLPGRALYIEINWLDNGSTTLLNIYTPNNKTLHPDFWDKVHDKRRAHGLRIPNFFLGDFNITEDPIDWAPMCQDDPTAIDALRDLRHAWNIKDAWRHTNPSERAYTYRANSNGQHIMSWIDRIYTNEATSEQTYDWKITPSAVPTDHWMVSVKYTPREAPYIGKGRWTWPLDALNNDKLMDSIADQGTQLEKDFDTFTNEPTDRASSNPQLLWGTFKDNIKRIAKEHTHHSHLKKSAQIKRLKSNHPNCREIGTSDNKRIVWVQMRKRCPFVITQYLY
jgi:exonuclease III